MDLGLVRADCLETSRFDAALAPLLPRCREAIRDNIYLEPDVGPELAKELSEELRRAAKDLEGPLSRAGIGAAERVAAELREPLMSQAAHDDAPLLAPWHTVHMQDFRATHDAKVDLSQVTVLHGANGAGKSSVFEALELLWTGRTQRMPSDADLADFGRHVVRDGQSRFRLRGWSDDEIEPREVDAVSAAPDGSLARTVLPQQLISDAVTSRPAERMARLLAVVGLDLGPFQARRARLSEQTAAALNALLSSIGVPPLARNNRADTWLKRELTVDIVARVSSPELLDAIAGLANAATDAGVRFDNAPLAGLDAPPEELVQFEGLANEVAASLQNNPDLPALAEAAAQQLRVRAAVMREVAERLNRAANELRGPPPEPQTGTSDESEALPRELAARWLSHAKGVSRAADQFRADAETLSGSLGPALLAYSRALKQAAKLAPSGELRRLLEGAPVPRVAQERLVDTDVIKAAGFSEPDSVLFGEELQAALARLAQSLEAHRLRLEETAREVKEHAVLKFAAREPEILQGAAEFELVRRLGLERTPLLPAVQRVLDRVIATPLRPVFQELAAALTRFEWYFHPMDVKVTEEEIRLTGGASEGDELDARFLLNAGESAVVGLAWFLALHVLQKQARGGTLLLDDPAGGFDLANQSAFVATLRGLARLLETELLVVSTHDNAFAETLEQEFASVEGWPRSVTRVRCLRDADGFTRFESDESRIGEANLHAERERLGLPLASEIETAPA